MVQLMTRPCSSLTSMKKKVWGFVHSTLVIVPASVTCLLESYWATNEWCAAAGAAIARPSAVNTGILIITALHSPFVIPGSRFAGRLYSQPFRRISMTRDQRSVLPVLGILLAG